MVMESRVQIHAFDEISHLNRFHVTQQIRAIVCINVVDTFPIVRRPVLSPRTHRKKEFIYELFIRLITV